MAFAMIQNKTSVPCGITFLIALGVWENLRYYGEFFMGVMIHCYHPHWPISEKCAI